MLVMPGLWLCLVALASVSAPASAVVGGEPASPPEPDAAVVFVQKKGRSCRVEGLKDDRLGYYSFYGIRYAEPPVGPRRFQRPERRLLVGDVAASRNCLPCPQQDPRNRRRIIGSEDCLCLNVFAPKMPSEEQGSPVVFFIHGGNYKSGSTASYGGQHLSQKDTILVTAQYRLGSLGYFSTAQKDASGNAGLFDLRAAMAWINDYIEFFGGDPNRVVVMGQGSGGSAASLIALSGEGRNAKGVVALSGTPLSPGAVRSDPAKYAKELANKTGCPEKPAERLIMCLRKLPHEKIVEADSDIASDNIDVVKFLDDISGRTGAGARVEGDDDRRALPPLVSEEPTDSLKNKRQPGPLLTGVTSAETSKAVSGKYSKFLTEQLSTVKDFIKNDLIGGLRGVVQGVEGLIPLSSTVTQILPLPDYYQALFDSSLNAVDGLTQIVEATGDALFNFPAYQTVQGWSEGSPAYLYSFEHIGNLSKGSHFLPGVPLAEDPENSTGAVEGRTATGPSHGDELAYIFEPLDENGTSVGGNVSSTDGKVRNDFVALIAKFAHDLKPVGGDNTTKSMDMLPFSKDNDQYIKIKDGISLDKNFRFCQMGLWGNMADRVTGTLCKNFLNNILQLPKLPVNFPAKLPTNVIPTNLPNANLPSVPGILGGTKPKESQKQNIINPPLMPSLLGGKQESTDAPKQAVQGGRATTKAPKRPGLGSLFGGL